MLSPAPSLQSCQHLPPALLLTGNSWIGDTGAQGRWTEAPDGMWGLPCSAQEWGASLCTPLCSRMRVKPLSPGATLERTAAAGGAHPSPTVQGVPGCRGVLGREQPVGPQGMMQHSRCGAFRKGLSDKETGQCHTPGFRVVHSPLQPGCKAPPFPRGGRAASEHGEEPGSSTAPLSAPPSCPVATPAACASSQPRRGSRDRDSPEQPSPPGNLRAKTAPGMSWPPGT